MMAGVNPVATNDPSLRMVASGRMVACHNV
jgi:hypothetical protein